MLFVEVEERYFGNPIWCFLSKAMYTTGYEVEALASFAASLSSTAAALLCDPEKQHKMRCHQLAGSLTPNLRSIRDALEMQQLQYG